MPLKTISILLLILSSSLSYAETIACGEGPGRPTISFDRSIMSLPLGYNGALIQNFPKLLHDYVMITEDPVFHLHQVTVETAYCRYVINVTGNENGSHVVLASQNCEGVERKMECEILPAQHGKIVTAKAESHYQPWSVSPDYVAEGLKAVVDSNGAKVCGAPATRISEYGVNYVDAHTTYYRINVTVMAAYQCS